ncbi:MAG: helix-turn-helix transcriptional regulator, partial [Chloroflexi bacterium]|nr:helix-turn-helix transcriptional regulator [Chloroflexota bacterium]
MTRETVGELMRAKRLALGWTPEQMAAVLDCHPAFVTRLERAGRTLPRFPLLKKLESLGLPAADLLMAIGALSPDQYFDARRLVRRLPPGGHLPMEEWLEEVRLTTAIRLERHR